MQTATESEPHNIKREPQQQLKERQLTRTETNTIL